MKFIQFNKTFIATTCLMMVALAGDAHAQLSINPFPLKGQTQSSVSEPANLLKKEDVYQTKSQQYTDWNDDIVVRAHQGQNVQDDMNAFASKPQRTHRDIRSWHGQPEWRSKGTVQVNSHVSEQIVRQPPVKETVVFESAAPALPKNAMYSSSPSVELYADPIMTSPQPAHTNFQQQTATWQAYRGASLYEVITTWADTQGVEVLWDVVESYKVQETTLFDGSFEEAIGNLLAQYEEQYTRPVGNLHLNPSGGRTLVIVSHKGA